MSGETAWEARAGLKHLQVDVACYECIQGYQAAYPLEGLKPNNLYASLTWHG